MHLIYLWEERNARPMVRQSPAQACSPSHNVRQQLVIPWATYEEWRDKIGRFSERRTGHLCRDEGMQGSRSLEGKAPNPHHLHCKEVWLKWSILISPLLSTLKSEWNENTKRWGKPLLEMWSMYMGIAQIAFDAPPPSLAKGRRGTVFWNPIFSFLMDPMPWGLWKDTLACLLILSWAKKCTDHHGKPSDPP